MAWPERAARWLGRHWKISLPIYLLLLIANYFGMQQANLGRQVWGERYMQSIGGKRIEAAPGTDLVRVNPLPYWVATRGPLDDAARPPVLLLHGSPGAAIGLTGLAENLAKSGRGVIWLDLPGFASAVEAEGRVYQSFSAQTYAHVMHGVLDELGVDRAHVLGWSNGGAVALRMIEQQPDRVSSLTLLASVGLQETEGSGSYAFEHAKYAAGYAALVWGGYWLPPIGYLGPPAETRAFLLNFAQTDQRALRPIMEALRTPTLILHGRHDFLTPSWGAERHHGVIPSSRLVMLDASHFIPFLQVDEATPILEAHFDRHDAPGITPLTTYEDRSPRAARHGIARLVDNLGTRLHHTPWWVTIVVIALLARWRPMLAIVVCGLFVGRVDLDILVAWLGLVAGRLWAPSTPFDDHETRLGRFLGGVGMAAGTFALLGLVFILEQDTIPLRVGPDDFTLRFGLAGLLVWLLAGPVVMHLLRSLPSRRGRQRLLAKVSRLSAHEWWPAWAIYLGVVPMWLGRILRGRGVLAFTAANPGIERGGGLVGESKNAILAALPADPAVLDYQPIDATGTPAQRAERALAAIQSQPELGGLPCVLKPESGERGASVKLARTEVDVRTYFEFVREPAQVQRYHAGPCEFGVFWVRTALALGDAPAGTITGITRKVFAEVRGNGRHTLGRLVLAHPRFRCQAGVFAQRHAARWHDVIGRHETVRLGEAGNHAQGCKFEDGSALTTPELEATINRLALGFAGAQGGELDYARFDVRTTSEGALRRGEIAVIEINGVTSEPAHLYDPALSIVEAWQILGAHWRHLYRIADARIAAGAKPLGAATVFRMWRASKKRVVLRAD